MRKCERLDVELQLMIVSVSVYLEESVQIDDFKCVVCSDPQTITLTQEAETIEYLIVFLEKWLKRL